MPVLFVNGTNDFAYPLDSYQRSYRLVKNRTLCITVNMPHGHRQGWAPAEIGLFVDAHLCQDRRLPIIEAVRRDGKSIDMTVRAELPIAGAALHFTIDQGSWKDRKWETRPAQVSGKTVRAELPAARPLVYFLTVTDSRKATVGTEHDTVMQ
jgi:hypothetical protein